MWQTSHEWSGMSLPVTSVLNALVVCIERRFTSWRYTEMMGKFFNMWFTSGDESVAIL